ncbi:MAG: succinate dehydrogenase cytochrome b subunit [Phycisphaerales bacterium]|nr:succinate dehydrogenase cytochrome b subunit [Phycisphaerales bacterium]
MALARGLTTLRLLNFYRTSIGKKIVVALSGAAMFLFLIAHMLGNLKIYGGQGDIDSYSHHLRTFMEDFFGYAGFLWIARVGLLAAVLLHVVTIVLLAKQNRRARPEGYRHKHRSARSIASMTMMISGPLILLYIIFHILQFTTGTIQPTPFQEGAVYFNLWHAFQVWWIALIYIVMMGFICLHLYHGVWSMFQSLGINNQDRNIILRWFSTLSAFAIFLGFISVPTLIWCDLLPPPSEEVMKEYQVSIDEGSVLVVKEGGRHEP